MFILQQSYFIFNKIKQEKDTKKKGNEIKAVGSQKYLNIIKYSAAYIK